MKLKQVALVSGHLSAVRSELFTLLGLDDDFADDGVAEFGLANSVMAIGDTFLEVVAPQREGTTAGRLLERRLGDGGYMVLLQVDDIEPVSLRVNKQQIRKVWEVDREEVTAFHVHPKDIGAAIVSFDEMRPSTEWLWAGPGWRDRTARHVGSINGVDIQCEDPERIAARWSLAFARTIRTVGDVLEIPLDEGTVRFVKATDGRGDGVCAIEFTTTDHAGLTAAAEQLDLSWNDHELVVCGTRLRFL